ncbi:MAG TPA: hypothetical protein VLY24_04465 [Bryobacteraceae bacterium]|nr:hypothetical protein [Bryobacteraceae bacterium]
MAELIRVRLQESTAAPRKRRQSPDPILKVAGVGSGAVLSSGIDDSLYGQ